MLRKERDQGVDAVLRLIRTTQLILESQDAALCPESRLVELLVVGGVSSQQVIALRSARVGEALTHDLDLLQDCFGIPDLTCRNGELAEAHVGQRPDERDGDNAGAKV